jgi:flagellar biogenesis protein FliO
VSPLAAYLVQTVVTLLGVVALAVLLLYGARRIGIGRPTGPIELVGRLPLDGRRVIYLIRVGGSVYVVAASEAGLNKLGELPADAVPSSAAARSGFAATLGRVLERPKGEAAQPGGDSQPGGGDA